KLVEGIESFRSTGISFIRPRLRNATFASNASGNFLVQDADITIESMSLAAIGSFSPNNPVFNINANISDQNVDLGGEIVNCRVTQDYINASHDLLFVVNVASVCAN